MAEVIISPGVFLNENDLSQIQQGPVVVGAALVGPTVQGPINTPTVVTSYTDYRSKFGSIFTTGSSTEEYITSLAAFNYFQQGGDTLLVTRIVSASNTYAPATASIPATIGTSFVLETITEGEVMNNNQGAGSAVNGVLPSGSVSNIRWEISAASSGSGLFTLTIRRGDDYTTVKSILETWSNLSLDPNQSNFISNIIGDARLTPVQDGFGNYQLQTSGSYENKSRYVRVKSATLTPDYLNVNGTPKSQFTASIPLVGSGSLNGAFGGGTGAIFGGAGVVPLNLFEKIPVSTATTPANNIQGLLVSDYDIALSLLSNKDWFDFEVIYAPGVTSQNAPSVVQSLLSLAESRGDAIAVVDMGTYNQAASTIVTLAASHDSSYGATYWPWVSVRSTETGKLRNIPASTIIPGVYEFSDKVSAEWFAPAGLTRGGLPTVIAPEKRLTRPQRDLLYNGKINPIAMFPGQGTVVYGQKTLQNRQTALDRVGVRRLLIALKRTIGRIAENFTFEQNTVVNRNRFVSQITPFLESVQQRQGLFSFRVVIDDTNNTPDVIDRNQLVGQIFLQPTRTAEFIILDFNILPTGATFGN